MTESRTEEIGASEEPPLEDVYAEFRELRANHQIHRDEDGPWRVARYEDVRHVLRAHGEFSSEVSERLRGDPNASPSMFFSDPPVHDRLRALVSRAFTPRRIAEQREAIEARCEVLVERMASHERADLVTALAAPLPVGALTIRIGCSRRPECAP